MQRHLAPILAFILLPAAVSAQEPDPQQDPQQDPQPQPQPQPEAEPEAEAEADPQPQPEAGTPVAEPPDPRDASWTRSIHQGAAASVVTIRCGWRRGVGFVFGAEDLVASTDAWDRCTRAIEVVLPGGRRLEVAGGRLSSEGGVALLRLPSASGLTPLEARGGAVLPGDRIALVGREGRGSGEVTVRPGFVISEPGRFIRTDLAPGRSPSGAAVVDAQGRVVGVARRTRHEDAVRVVPVARLSELAEAPAEEPLGRPLSVGLGAFGALLFDEDPNEDPEGNGRDVTLGGFGAQIRASLFDRLTLVGGYWWLRDMGELFEAGVVDRSARRHQADLRLGWRFLAIPALRAYVTPSLGAWASWTTWTDRRLRIQLTDPACDLGAGSACELTTDTVEEEDDHFAITPYAHLALQAGALELGYSLGLAVDGPGTFVHRLVLGLWFGGD